MVGMEIESFILNSKKNELKIPTKSKHTSIPKR